MEPQNVQTTTTTSGLAGDIRVLIGEARAGLAATVNSALTMLYWRIGRRIHAEVLQGERAGYGEQIVALLAQQLEADHGRSIWRQEPAPYAALWRGIRGRGNCLRAE